MFYVGLDEIRQQKVRAAGARRWSPALVHVNGGIYSDRFAIGIGNRQPLYTCRHASGKYNTQRIHVYERGWADFVPTFTAVPDVKTLPRIVSVAPLPAATLTGEMVPNPRGISASSTTVKLLRQREVCALAASKARFPATANIHTKYGLID
jgi:hypothetical protein